MHKLILLALTLTLPFGCSASPEQDVDILAATGGEENPRIVALENYQQALELFAELNYTPEAWQAGIREVPRIYLAEITDRWSKVTTKEIDVTLKKRLFFRALGPLALRSNELISQDRARLEAIKTNTFGQADKQEWLNAIAAEYGLDTNELSEDAIISALLERVDIIPPSLVLAQAAEESGWGTSRFAFTGNALFGQWTWGDKGIRPEQQREAKGDYKIAAFDAPLQSVQAHAKNLNTHQAYAEFRKQRATLRSQNKRISGTTLAGSLTSYSERGDDYVTTLRSIISFNKLDPVDDAFLNDEQAIVLIDPDI